MEEVKIMSSVENLLTTIAHLNQEYENRKKVSGRTFNLLDILNVSYDEVKICRIITELINPYGTHNQGTLFLSLFIRDVLHMQLTDDEIKKLHVKREYHIKNDRRIDIVLKSTDCFIPIEVKLYASDQQDQCYDYYQYAKKSKVYYLTIDGHLPSVDSASKLTAHYENNGIKEYDEVYQISFRNEIVEWLRNCIKDRQSQKYPAVSEALIQLLQVIERISGISEEGTIMDVIKLISKSGENMKAAIQVADNVKKAKCDLIYRLLDEIRTTVNPIAVKYGLQEEEKEKWYDYRDQSYAFYDNKGESSFPAINYVCKGIDIGNGLELWFRIEIDHVLAAGFCVFNTKKHDQQDIISSNLLSLLHEKIMYEIKPNIWWIVLENLPNGLEEETPDFKIMNEVALKLCDDDYRKRFIGECVLMIENMLKSIKNKS